MNPLPALTDSDIARFWQKVDKGDGFNTCWTWTGKKNDQGYGRLTFHTRPGDGKNRRSVLAHRISYFLATGEDPYPLLVRHDCDVPSCVNPDHLRVGTHQDNFDDMIKRHRTSFMPGIETDIETQWLMVNTFSEMLYIDLVQ